MMGDMNYRFEILKPAHFPLLESWFDDAQTQAYLGNREELHQAIELMRAAPGSEYGGLKVRDRLVWVVFREAPVALVDVEIYDDQTASFAFMVAPTERGRGVGQEVLRLLEGRPELRDTKALIGSIAPGNLASRKCLEKAGFTIAATLDEEGMYPIERAIAHSRGAS